MKSIILLTTLMCLLCPLSAFAKENKPSRSDKLLLQDNMLVLWSMGLKENTCRTQDILCQHALFFVILSEKTLGSSGNIAERSENPDIFQNIAENYQGFVPKHKVEEVAQTVFNQKINRHIAPEGSSFDGNGYFLDYSALSDKTGYLCHLMPDDRRPGHVYRPIEEPINDTSWTVYAKLMRILKDADGSLIVMKRALFSGEVYYQDGTLRIKSFSITENDEF